MILSASGAIVLQHQVSLRPMKPLPTNKCPLSHTTVRDQLARLPEARIHPVERETKDIERSSRIDCARLGK